MAGLGPASRVLTMNSRGDTVDDMTEARPLRSYGRRKGKALSARKERLLSELLPELRVDLRAAPPARSTSLFTPKVEEAWLEIGFGSGEHLLWQAEHHPDVGFIGCEPFVNGMASLLGAIEDRGIKTVRVHDGDARDVLAWLPDASIGRVFLLFPDPWPKKRQLKRRLFTQDFVSVLARVLRPGGEFRFATDDADYAEQARLLLVESGAFRAASGRDRPADWPETRYERKALSEGRTPAHLRFNRA
jgi:tRNA (guanine-N7-)-methyltransferase